MHIGSAQTFTNFVYLYFFIVIKLLFLTIKNVQSVYLNNDDVHPNESLSNVNMENKKKGDTDS